MRVAFKTFGCRLNQAETERFAAGFAAAGWQVVSWGTPADVAVIHGCAVTGTAEQECLRLARGVKRHAQQAGVPEPFVVLVGCVVEAAANRGPVPGVDLLVPRRDKERLAAIVFASLGGTPSGSSGPCELLERDDGHPRPSHRVRALLKVQDGCDFFCSYCIVPHLRGAPVSRPWHLVLDEARALAQAGCAEIVVTGCNVACYRDGARGLADLVAAIAALDEVQRIRLSSIEPATAERAIVDLMAACPKLCRYLHLPLQSGDAEMLRRMRRRYTPEAFAETVRHAAARIPDLGLGTDVITGFPGETDAAFDRTRELLAGLPFSNLHVFPYSERPGTPAAGFGEAVPRPVRKARAAELIRLREEKRQAFAQTFVGRPVEVLVERIGRDGLARGWTGPYLDCRVAGIGRAAVGTVVTFTPSRAGQGMLFGAAGA
jgi:threonylcarbamoyladenosine tRNA methylthiotransferase MtaB